MYSILLVVEKPDKAKDGERHGKWLKFVENLKENIQPNTDLQVLGQNVVLISLDEDLRTLCSVVELIPKGLNYKYAIFGEEIEWFPKTKKV